MRGALRLSEGMVWPVIGTGWAAPILHSVGKRDILGSRTVGIQEINIIRREDITKQPERF